MRDVETLLLLAEMARDHYRSMEEFHADQAREMGKTIWAICAALNVPTTPRRPGDKTYFGMWNERDILATITERCTSPALLAPGLPGQALTARGWATPEPPTVQLTELRTEEGLARLTGHLHSSGDWARFPRPPMAHRLSRWARAKRWLLEPTGSRSARTTHR